jgi:hypothetical protein
MHVSDNGRYLVDDEGTPYHVRKAAYTCMLSGALGHTYGCRDVQAFYVPSDEPPRYDVDTWWK